jgi:hypothetical protein
MRLTQLSDPFQLVWNRISFSRLTLFYFFFSVAHFVIQLSFQIKAFTINAQAATFLTRIVTAADTTNDGLPFLRDDTLRMCSWVPANLNVDVASCPVVWSGDASQSNTVSKALSVPGDIPVDSITAPLAVPSSPFSLSIPSSFSMPTSPPDLLPTSTSTVRVHETITVLIIHRPSIVASIGAGTPIADVAHDDNDDDGYQLRPRDVQIIPSQQGQPVSVTLVGLAGDKNTVLDDSCLWSLNWPVSVLGNTKREDMVFIAFQFWVLGMSIVALLNESIPHILASLVTHLMATAWAGFQITHTASFRSDFSRVITHGACKNISLLPHYWDARGKAEIPSLALNVIALFVSSFLTWKLIKLFGWQTFKRVGASLTINRVYKLVLFLSITIQLSLFFMIVTVSLWVDQLMNSLIGDLADFQKLYKVTSFITLALLIPWLMTGWFAVRRELRVPMFVFLLLSTLYLGGWGVMFFSTTFRWTFVTWRFFSIMASASVLLTVLSIILGVVCRYNFGKGLARYLNAQQPLDEKSFPPLYGGSDIEKVAFPSSEKPLPTYISFEKQDPTVVGPRFTNEPFETRVHNLALPLPTLQRNLNDVQVHRSESYGSTRSHGSSSSQRSLDSDNSHVGNKRWVIE